LNTYQKPARHDHSAQNLRAKWGPFRRFAPPNVGQRHFPLYEASLLSMRTIEAPFIPYLFSLLFSCRKTDVSFSSALTDLPQRPKTGNISVEISLVKGISISKTRSRIFQLESLPGVSSLKFKRALSMRE